MRIATLENTVLHVPGNNLLPGIRYLIEDQNVVEFASPAKGHIQIQRFNPQGQYPAYLKHSGLERKEKDRLLILRQGAMGDLVFLKPLFEELTETYDVTIACMSRFHWLFKDTKIKCLNTPLEIDAYMGHFEVVVTLETLNEDKQGYHPQTECAKVLGLDTKKRKPSYKPQEYLVKQMLEAYPKKGKKRIAISCDAGVGGSWNPQLDKNQLRSYPKEKIVEVLEPFYQDHEFVVIGAPGMWDISSDPLNHVINLTKKDHSWEEQIAFLSTCYVLLGVDSGNTHLAGAMDVPTVALYAPFHWQDRTSVFTSVLAIQGLGKCAPCYWHPHDVHPYPKEGECRTTGRCEVLANIDIKRIQTALRKKLND